MSLHHSQGDIEEGEISPLSPIFDDTQHTIHIELVEYPSYDNPRPPSSATVAVNPKTSTSEANLSVRVGSFFVGWWARITSLFVSWWARVKSFVVDWWARVIKLFIDWWMGELLGILLSITTLFAIIYALRKYDGRNLPTLPHNVSLNFVISTLATVSKSSLLFAVASALGQFKWLWMFFKQRQLQDLQVFDDASRGPLGASRLLASKKRLSWASIGAVVTILCLIYDPFIQGLINVSERIIYKDNPASIVKKLEKYPFDRYIDVTPDYKLINIISDTAFNPIPLSETQPRCPTANCTWPSFTSLGFCFKCENIGQALRDSSSFVDEHEDSLNITGPDGRINAFWRVYTYKLPKINGQVLRSAGDYMQFDARSFSFRFSVMTNASDVSTVGDPELFIIRLAWNANTPFNFTDGSSIPTNSLLLFIRVSKEIRKPGDVLAADLCALSFCAQKRNISVTLNQLFSTVVQTEYGKTTYPNPKNRDRLIEIDLGEKFTYTLMDSSHPEMEYLTKDNVNGLSAKLEGLLSTFAGNVTMTDYESIPSVQHGLITAFNASSNISMTMDNIAIAITNYYRDSSNVTVIGQSGQNELFVHVNWPWITLPIFLVLAATMFLFLAMFETKRLKASIWKTSELALLFHGSEDSYQDLNALDQSSEMMNVAEGIKARMTKTSDGKWVLRRENLQT